MVVVEASRVEFGVDALNFVMCAENLIKVGGKRHMENFFHQKITILVSIPRFLIANIPNPALKKFVLDLKKYFIIKKWFFQPKKVKVFSLKPMVLDQKIVFFDADLP